ncbi:long form salivary protein D7L1-like [Ochlerotatus camptorhynchus]|uniref:long form salivary protein D7L1-like n=1 Tax=Ochlerotatus camptorhynchus TaxID=644619 RepID=UPI0031DF2952
MGFTTFVVIAAFLSTVASQAPFDPEEMLFIFTRCMEDNLKDDASRLPTLAQWKEWEEEPAGDKATHCFAKCILDKTGLYNPSTGKFDADVIKKQSEEYPNSAAKSKVDEFIKAVQQLPNTDNECTAVFNAYVKVHNDHKTTSKNLFHGNKELTTKIYEKLNGQIRQKGQSYFVFCEDKFYPEGSNDRQKLCEIRQYKVLDDDVFKRHTECIMKGLRYITKNNQLDREEIKRDFKQVGKDTASLEQALDNCKVPSKDIAWEYYKCLVESPVADDFKEAFDYREIRSQQYGYNLKKKQAYSKPSVQSQVMEIDGKQCPTAA